MWQRPPRPPHSPTYYYLPTYASVTTTAAAAASAVAVHLLSQWLVDIILPQKVMHHVFLQHDTHRHQFSVSYLDYITTWLAGWPGWLVEDSYPV